MVKKHKVIPITAVRHGKSKPRKEPYPQNEDLSSDFSLEKTLGIKFGWNLKGSIGSEGLQNIMEFMPQCHFIMRKACDMIQPGGNAFHFKNIC